MDVAALLMGWTRAGSEQLGHAASVSLRCEPSQRGLGASPEAVLV